MIITVDGPAGAGKGTLSAFLAQKYKLAYFDTGMVYRAVGLQMVLDGRSLEDIAQAEKIARNLTFPQMMTLAKHKDFRSDVGSYAASVVSSYPSVRAALLKMQQDFALNPVFADGTPANGVVYDGRDTGTVICPQADLKFYITAPVEVRAQRRCRDLVAAGLATDYDKVLTEMKARDARDMQRASAPLVKPEGAVEIDTSLYPTEQNMADMAAIIDKKFGF